MDDGREPPARQLYVWSFAHAEYDSSCRELRVAGRLRSIEGKPLALLEELLRRRGEVTTPGELKAAVWPEVTVNDGSIPNAIVKLRDVLGDERRAIIRSVRGVGYRIGVPVTERLAEETAESPIIFHPEAAVPGRPHWRFERALVNGRKPGVWLASSDATKEKRVFKFADTATGLEGLRREALFSKVLFEGLGARPDFLRVIDRNFETRPYFLASAFGGVNLLEWAEARGGLGTIPLKSRIRIVIQIARTVAAAHSVGVLHRDLKPSNVLVTDEGDEHPGIKLVDFGSGRLTEAAASGAAHITDVDLARGEADGSGPRSGTLLYASPELLKGKPPTTGSDIYALGIILYQMIVADFSRSFTPGWEDRLQDPLLAADIAEAASEDPERRLPSAALLAERLEGLHDRRAQRDRERQQAEGSARQAEKLRRAALLRPWIILALVSLLIGFVVAAGALLFALRRGDEARRQAEIAQAVNHFLTDDLLTRGDPERAGHADETLTEAAGRAEAAVDKRFSSEPLVAGSIHLAIAQAFDRRTNYAEARASYELAIAAFLRAQGSASPDALISRLRLATMEALSVEAGGKARAQAQLAGAKDSLPALGPRAKEAKVWLNAANGAVELGGGDAAQALSLFKDAADRADSMPDIFDESRRLWLRQKQAISLFRLGRWNEADTLLTSLLPRQVALHGPRDADTLLIELTQAQVLMGRGATAPAVAALDRLYPAFVATYGADHRLTTRVLAARAQCLGQLERYDEAIRDGLALHQSAVSRQGENSWMAIATLSDVAESQCRAGHGEVGLITARQALATAAGGFGPKSSQAMAMMGEVAFCLIVAGHDTESTQFLDAIDPNALVQLGAGPDFPAQIDVMRADIALSVHDIPRARALLERPAKVFGRPDADPYVKRWTKRLLALSGQ